jgi:hypothetical protein
MGDVEGRNLILEDRGADTPEDQPAAPGGNLVQRRVDAIAPEPSMCLIWQIGSARRPNDVVRPSHVHEIPPPPGTAATPNCSGAAALGPMPRLDDGCPQGATASSKSPLPSRSSRAAAQRRPTPTPAHSAMLVSRAAMDKREWGADSISWLAFGLPHCVSRLPWRPLCSAASKMMGTPGRAPCSMLAKRARLDRARSAPSHHDIPAQSLGGGMCARSAMTRMSPLPCASIDFSSCRRFLMPLPLAFSRRIASHCSDRSAAIGRSKL